MMELSSWIREIKPTENIQNYIEKQKNLLTLIIIVQPKKFLAETKAEKFALNFSVLLQVYFSLTLIPQYSDI